MMFKREDFPRAQCIQLAENEHWNNIILVSIIVNCLLMAFLYDPLDVRKHKDWRDGLDIFFTFLFMFEMFVKVIAQGLFFAPQAYLKDGWNIMDGTIVWVSFVCLDFVSGGVKGLGGVRAMRGIRPLRTLSRFKSGALFVNTLFSSWVYIWNVFVFLMWFVVLAACSGTVLFKGGLRSRCVELTADLIAAAGGDAHKATCPHQDILRADPTTYPVLLDDATGDPVVCGESFQNCPATHTCCLYGDEIGNGMIRFDNILWSSLITFQGLTIDGWNEVCYVLMDGLGWPVLLWYAVVVVCGAFFVMQLLSAVIVTSLQKCSAEQELSEQLDKEREKRREVSGLTAEKTAPWYSLDALWESEKMASTRRVLRLHIPALYDFAEKDVFNNFIMLMIAANTVVMMTRHYPESDEFVLANVIMEYIFNSVFIVEFVIKHLGYGLAGYWSVGWNRLDGIIVLSSLIDMISPLFGDGVDLGFMRALRVLRVMRAVRVLKAAPEAMAVMNSMVVSLTSMGGFLLVWLIFMLIYALLGTRLYGGACVFQLDEDAGRLSFDSFMKAMLTLFITASGEDGFDVMHWTMEAAGNSSAFFMISWMIISQIILSLLLALLIDSYSVDDDEEGATGVLHQLDSGVSINKELIDLEERMLAERSQQEREDGDADRRRSRDSSGGLFSTPTSQSLGGASDFFTKDGVSMKSGGMSHRSAVSKRSGRYLDSSRLPSRAAGSVAGSESSSVTRAQMLEHLKIERAKHEVAVVRQWLYDIELEFDEKRSNQREIVMTAEQERKAKERLDLRRQIRPLAKPRQDLARRLEHLSLAGRGMAAAIEAHKAEKAESESATSSVTGASDSAGSSDAEARARGAEEDEGAAPRDAADANAKAPGGWGYMGTEWLKIVENEYFTNFILLAILWSSIMLAMETPRYPAPGSRAEEVFFGIDVAFTVVFTVEMGLQWMALGLGGYFRQTANKLDFIIVFTAWLSLILEISGVDAGTLTALRSLRLLRILRPLRAVRRLPALRMVVDCTMNAIPAIKWIMVLGAFLAVILGLFGMQFFGGKMWSCQFPAGVAESFGDYSDESSCVAAMGEWGDRTLTECENELAAEEIGEPFLSATSPVTLTECTMPKIVTKEECRRYNGTWANQEYNFDNIGQALVVVFVASTADNWQDTMYNGIDTVDIGKNMIYGYNMWNCIYYVVVTMLSCFFWANMFVSTLVDQYTKASEAEGILTLEDNLKSALVTKALLLEKQQEARGNHWAERENMSDVERACVRVASNPWFGRFMMGVIMLNGFVLMCIHADQPGWLDEVDFITSILFQVLYCFEVIILMTAMKPMTYLEDPWNRFDLAIVVAGFIELVVDGDAPWIAVLRTFRIMRLFKIVKGLNELRILMYTIFSAVPGVSNIGVLLFLLMFMYACLGVTLYGDVGSPYGYPDGLNKYTNFRSWPNAMFTLFVVFTGNWESIFRATYWQCEGGPDDWGRECTYRYSAPFYFFSYFILANCVLGNLFVSIILDKFTAETTAGEGDKTSVLDVVRIAFMLSQFRTMLAEKIRIYRMLVGALSREDQERAETQYAHFVADDWDGVPLMHDEAFRIVSNLRDMRGVMFAAHNKEWIARGGSPVTVLSGGASEESGDRGSPLRAYRVVGGDDSRMIETSAAAETNLRVEPKDTLETASRKSGRSASDPERDAARDRRRRDRDRDERERPEGIPEDSDEYDSVDGDDLLSRGDGRSPGPGPRDPNGRSRGQAEESQNWLSGCSFIPGLDYCALPPERSKR